MELQFSVPVPIPMPPLEAASLIADRQRVKLATQKALLEKEFALELLDHPTQSEVVPAAIPRCPKLSFVELAEAALAKKTQPAPQPALPNPSRVAVFQQMADRIISEPRMPNSDIPTRVDPAQIAVFQAMLERPVVPVMEAEVEHVRTTDPQIFRYMLENPKPVVEKIVPEVDLNALFPQRAKFVPGVIQKEDPNLKIVEPVWDCMPHTLSKHFFVSEEVNLEWCADDELPIPSEPYIPLELYVDSSIESLDTAFDPTVGNPKFAAQMRDLLQNYRASFTLEGDDRVISSWTQRIGEHAQGLPFHWHCACKKLEVVDAQLGKVRLLARIVYTVAFSSGQKVFSLPLWKIAGLMEITPDYVSELLTTYEPLLRRLFCFREKFRTIAGKEYSEGYIWLVDRDVILEGDLLKLPKVVGNLEMFKLDTRDLEADILAGYTNRAFQAKEKMKTPVAEKTSKRGKNRNATSRDTVARLDLLEECCQRAEGLRPSMKSFSLHNNSSRYDVSDAVNAPVGLTNGERVGWVRRLGSGLASFLGGVGDLKLWFKVGWRALELEATNILADVVNEVIIRNQDAYQQNSSAILLSALFDRGLILQE